MKQWIMIGIVLFLSGCQTDVSKTLFQNVDAEVSFEAIQKTPEAHRGKRILAGGEIIAIRNLKEATEIEVLQKPLGPDRSPILSDQSGGRFLVRHPAFLDPTIFKIGRRITVSGKIVDRRVVKIGEAEMTYPVLEESQLHLWPVALPDRYVPRIGFGFGYSTIFGD